MPRSVNVVVQRWVTGERAEKDGDLIQRELEDFVAWVDGAFRTAKVVWPPTDKGFWKLGRLHTDKHSITYDVYRCPMSYRWSATSVSKL